MHSKNFIKKYDLIVSIGAACSCTETLRMKELQVFSYPFDWVACSDFINRVKKLLIILKIGLILKI